METTSRICNSEQTKVTADSRALVGRRRFVRGVAAVVPVVLTVGSRSVLGRDVTCLSPSASASISLLNSRPGRDPDGSCAGKSPGYWKNAFANFGITIARSANFDAVFGSGPTGTMEDVCATTGDADHAALARHLAAAWCNLQAGLVSPTVLDLGDLQAMWAGRFAGYSPVAGVTWFDTDMITYLTTTMT